MAIRRTCDICGADVNDIERFLIGQFEEEFGGSLTDTETFDLCEDCDGIVFEEGCLTIGEGIRKCIRSIVEAYNAKS